MLKGVDALVFDIQDVGARFYTYSCTMLYGMEEAAKSASAFLCVGPAESDHRSARRRSDAGPGSESVRRLFRNSAAPRHDVRRIGEDGEWRAETQDADLHVIAMQGWNRGDWFDSTGLPWIDPSPNMRSLNAATLYPGIAMLESSPNYSVGRGTDAPFEQIGADWIHGPELAAFLNSRYIPGVRVYPTRFRPTSAAFRGKEHRRRTVRDYRSQEFDSTRLGLEIAYALGKLYPGKIAMDAKPPADRKSGSDLRDEKMAKILATRCRKWRIHCRVRQAAREIPVVSIGGICPR